MLIAVLIAMGAVGPFSSGAVRAQHALHANRQPSTACNAPNRLSGLCHAAGYDYESKVFNADKDAVGLPLVLALHWSSSEPNALLKALGPQASRFRVILPYARHKKRDGFSFFTTDFYELSPNDQREGVKDEAARLANFVREIQSTYHCPGPILILGASQGGDLSFQLSHDHPQLVAASFPLLGRNMIGPSAGWRNAAPVTAYFSLTDPIVDTRQAQASVNAVRNSGGAIEVKNFSADGHDISEEMAAEIAKDLRVHLPRVCKQGDQTARDSP